MSNIYNAPQADLNHEGDNNSGQGKGSVPPPGVTGWSWGAFLLNWIWSLGNGTYIGLLAMVPYVGIIMAIVLGIKGREWAWQNKRWDSVEHFNRVQKKWSAWAVGILVVPALLGIIAAIVLPMMNR
jgi:hypothetical protein